MCVVCVLGVMCVEVCVCVCVFKGVCVCVCGVQKGFAVHASMTVTKTDDEG